MMHCVRWLLRVCSNWVTRRLAVLKGWHPQRPGPSPLSVVRSVNSIIHLRVEVLRSACNSGTAIVINSGRPVIVCRVSEVRSARAAWLRYSQAGISRIFTSLPQAITRCVSLREYETFERWSLTPGPGIIAIAAESVIQVVIRV